MKLFNGTFAGIVPVSFLEDRKLESINSNSLVNKIRILYNKEIQNIGMKIAFGQAQEIYNCINEILVITR